MLHTNIFMEKIVVLQLDYSQNQDLGLKRKFMNVNKNFH